MAMTRGPVLLVLVIAFSFCVAGGATPAAPGPEAHWVIRDLGSLGGAESVALALNEHGQVAGWSQTSSGAKHLFLWEKGRMRDLGVSIDESQPVVMNDRVQIAGSRPTLGGFVWEGGTIRGLKAPGGGIARPADINESGEVVGTSRTRAFRWQKGRLRVLPALAGSRAMEAIRVNEKGQIVGRAALRAFRAVEWDADGRLIDLGSVTTAGKISSAIGINDHGQVVGSIQVDYGIERAAMWSKGKLTQLPALRDGDDCYALAINRGGLILGFSYPRGLGQPENARGLVWKGTKPRNLGTLISNCYDACDTTPGALNDAGQVVGVTRIGSGADHAFVWQDGRMHDLGALPGREASSRATAINGHNRIIGTSTVDGKRHAVIWSLTR